MSPAVVHPGRASAGRGEPAARGLGRLLAAAGALVLRMFGLRALEAALLYFPDRRPGGEPADYGLRAEV